ncbi:phosphatidylinositol N-acetylglucosaminyltransferase subunit H isoform X1 [Onychostruthus taczanowskii]|uniref:phosphatidylinositol N-acetylglucosaminyltransferase subunit H isoform X1 n=1 Tax=Onychostruthus taczanowskii TaxID=356909 RepID=UPI001B80005F|nr:phosphatidylinositol N-acetylglucosaminyltransferase subunit H isoform X1 [Onychostruthus taczanowskii]
MAEERRFLSASGVPIALRRRQHSASCRELAVRGPRLQLRSLSAATSAVWLAAYGLFALSENSMVLSAAIFITLIGLIIYLHFVKIDQESLLVIGSLGIQVTSSYASGKESTTFIEMGQVKDVVINEAIHMQKVIYYLCILLQDPEDPQGVSEVVPLFQFCFPGNILALVELTPAAKESCKPRLDCLIEVYKSCQEILEQRKTAHNQVK